MNKLAISRRSIAEVKTLNRGQENAERIRPGYKRSYEKIATLNAA